MGGVRINIMAGEKFGDITFIEKIKVPAGDSPKAKFLCVCGKEFVTRIGNIRSGETKSCGCLTKAFLSVPKIQYSAGEKMGDCIYLRDAPYNPSWPRKAYFICQCGSEFITTINSVQSGETRSCGCMTNKFLSESGSREEKEMPTMSKDDLNRFWDKISYSMDINVCWNWQATGDRYGAFKVKGSTYKASRLAYFIAFKEDPLKLSVMHSCDNPKCCNPKHLSLGTHWENMQDMAYKGRAYNGKIPR